MQATSLRQYSEDRVLHRNTTTESLQLVVFWQVLYDSGVKEDNIPI